MPTIRILDLCCGTMCLKKAIPLVCAASKYNVEYIGVDIDPSTGADVIVDIVKWDYASALSANEFDVVFAWPDCRNFSDAKTTGVSPEDFENSIALVTACINIIVHINPKMWVIENPCGRKDRSLWKQACMQHLERFKLLTNYCMYGFPYPKPTNLWTNAMVTLRRCTPETPCVHREKNGNHLTSVTRYGISTKHSVPLPLLLELMDAYFLGAVDEALPVPSNDE